MSPGIMLTSTRPSCMSASSFAFGGGLVRREVKTETSEAPLPLPDLCVTALKIRRQ